VRECGLLKRVDEVRGTLRITGNSSELTSSLSDDLTGYQQHLFVGE
jgi:hypothetical protein